MKIPTTIARIATGAKRSKIFCASGPCGLSVFCPLFFASAQPASASDETTTATRAPRLAVRARDRRAVLMRRGVMSPSSTAARTSLESNAVGTLHGPCSRSATSAAGFRVDFRANHKPGIQYPRRSSEWARRCQSRSTETRVSRKTRVPSSALELLARLGAGFLQHGAAACRSRSPSGSRARRGCAPRCGAPPRRPNRRGSRRPGAVSGSISATTVIECGSSSRAIVSSCSRTSSAARNDLGLIGDHAVGVVVRALRAGGPRSRRRARRRPHRRAPRAARRRRSRRAPRRPARGARRPRSRSTRSILLTTSIVGVSTACTSSATNRSPRPIGARRVDRPCTPRRPRRAWRGRARWCARRAGCGACGSPACRAARSGCRRWCARRGSACAWSAADPRRSRPSTRRCGSRASTSRRWGVRRA